MLFIDYYFAILAVLAEWQFQADGVMRSDSVVRLQNEAPAIGQNLTVCLWVKPYFVRAQAVLVSYALTHDDNFLYIGMYDTSKL